MAFSGNAMCDSFKSDILQGLHDFTVSTGNSFKMALYDNSATLDDTTTAYTVTGELAASGNYTTTGNALTNALTPVWSSTAAITDFDDEVWSTATFTAYGALIYNDTVTTPVADPSVIVLDFGGAKTATAGDFTVQFPAPDATNAIIRIA